ncbi:MAG: hypothetical protein OXH09_12305 [Gammaproteobacteria bacterium]|nr:hypothetical protein [Gammaproteobacteria bacterium]
MAIGTASLVESVYALGAEGMHTQWAEDTIEEVLKMKVVLYASGADTKELDSAIESSGIVALQALTGPG